MRLYLALVTVLESSNWPPGCYFCFLVGQSPLLTQIRFAALITATLQSLHTDQPPTSHLDSAQYVLPGCGARVVTAVQRKQEVATDLKTVTVKEKRKAKHMSPQICDLDRCHS